MGGMVGNQHKTTAFGTCCERYCASLYGMGVVGREGHLDLSFFPSNGSGFPFSMEVKSGRNKKVELVWNQLRYSFLDEEKVIGYLGDHLDNGMLESILRSEEFVPEHRSIYYSLIRRAEGLSSKSLVGDYASINIVPDDQWVLPSLLVPFYYAASLASRRNGGMDEYVDIVLEGVVGSFMGEERISPDDRDNWSHIPFSSVRAIFDGDSSSLRNATQRRTVDNFLSYVRANTSFSLFQSSVLEGPLDTKVHILYDPSEKFIANMLSRNIRRRTLVLEEVLAEREEVAELLSGHKLTNRIEERQRYNGGISDDRRFELVELLYEQFGLGDDFVDKLERLMWWKTEDDVRKDREVSQKLVDDEIPF